MVDRKFLNADLGWRNFDLVDKHDTVDHHTPLLLPPTIRGVVLGLSARCVGSVIDPPPPDLPNKLLCGALCIVFDSESIGFAGALARVFERVAVINFSEAYSNYQNPVSVGVNNSSLVVGMTTPHDIIMTDRVIETQVDTGEGTKLIIRKRAVTRFYDDFIDEIWKPGYIYSKRLDDIKAAGGGKTIRVNDLSHLNLAQYLTDYIVIGPISTDIQRATVNMFLDTKKGFISQDAVLVTIQPLEISGVKVDSNLFPQFIPFGFKPLPHIAPDPTRVEALQQAHPHLSIYSWPQKTTSSCSTETAGINRGVQPGALNEWVVTTGDTRSKFRFSLFTCESSRLLQSQATSGTKRDQSATTGGQTAAKQDQAATTVTPHGKGEGKSLSDTGSD
jgi:hypothetical protein